MGLVFPILALFSSCDRNEFVPQVPNDSDDLQVRLFNEINQLTKTRINDEGFCDGDAVGVYVVNYSAGNPGTLAVSGNQADNVKYTLQEASGKWVPSSPVYYYDKKTHVDIYGYYPYGSPSSVTEYAFEVQKDQSKDAANGNLSTYEASDFLWAKASDITPSSSVVTLRFQHKMAGVMVTLVEGTGFAEGEFASVSKAVLVTNTVRTAKINLSTGVVTPTGDVPNTGIVPIEYQGDYRAIVVPQTVPAQVALFTLTVDGLPYTFRKDEAMEYTPGKIHKFSISVSKKSESGLEFNLIGEAITPWEADNVSHDGVAREYVVIHCPEAGKLKETIVAQGKDYTKIKNLKVTGSITSDDYYFMRDEMFLLQSVNLKEVESRYYSYRPGNDSVSGIPPCAFSGKKTLARFVFPDNIELIDDAAFSETNLVGSLLFPNSLKIIGSSAFASCPINGTITFPESLVSIETYAFNQCSQIRGGLHFPVGVKTIGNYAFQLCSSLDGTIFLPSSMEELGAGAFLGCKHLTGSLIIPEKITSIPEAVFNGCSQLDGELVLPKGLISVGTAAFNSCSFRYPIVLPESLINIGEDAFRYCQFSGQLNLPNELAAIGPCAFGYNKRMTGTIILPEGLTSVGEQAFAGCSQLEGIVLPKSLESLGALAFWECYYLTSIVSHALIPPALSDGVFNGVGKDNLTIEVPETAVNDYITAPGWNEFKRFSAHREFSVSRNLFRTLNAENSKDLIIRAPGGQTWSVESKPEWITVVPDHGSGNTEIVVTVSALARNSGNREGEVVFLMDGKDYRVRTKVEQYDYEYGDGDVITNQTHTVGNGVNLVFMGDCFDAKDIAEGKYVDGINEAIGYFFAIEPYKTYKDYFNVYTVLGLSPDSGVGTVNTIRESRFGTQYTLNAGLAPDYAACFEAACLAPINDDVSKSLIVMIENSDQYGGVCYMYGDGSAIALCPMSRDLYPYDYRGLVQHEAGGHGFGKLADEYIYHNCFVTACPYCGDYLEGSGYYHYKTLGWYENIHHSGKLHDVPWYHLMFDEDYTGTVDIYEGAFLHSRGIFRSETTSCMNNNIPYYSAISRESIVKRILNYAGEEYTFDGFKANDVRTAEPTKSSWGFDVIPGYNSMNHQHEPVYLGDKPVFNKPVKK